MPKVIPEHLRISPQPFRQWCAWRLDRAGWMRPKSEPEEGAVADLALALDISERKLHRWRNEFLWLDRLEVEDALRHAGFELWDVWPDIEEIKGFVPRPQHQPGYGSRLTDKQVLDLHSLYLRGVPVQELASRIYVKAGYPTVDAARKGIHRGFRRLGLDNLQPYQPHGFYRRCTAVKTGPPGKGTRCRRWAATGKDYCAVHDPGRAEENVLRMARATEAKYGVAA